MPTDNEHPIKMTMGRPATTVPPTYKSPYLLKSTSSYINTYSLSISVSHSSLTFSCGYSYIFLHTCICNSYRLSPTSQLGTLIYIHPNRLYRLKVRRGNLECRITWNETFWQRMGTARNTLCSPLWRKVSSISDMCCLGSWLQQGLLLTLSSAAQMQ